MWDVLKDTGQLTEYREEMDHQDLERPVASNSQPASLAQRHWKWFSCLCFWTERVCSKFTFLKVNEWLHYDLSRRRRMGSGQTKPKVQPVVRRLSRKENAKTKLGNAPSSDDGRDNVRTVLTPAPRHHLREALKTALPHHPSCSQILRSFEKVPASGWGGHSWTKQDFSGPNIEWHTWKTRALLESCYNMWRARASIMGTLRAEFQTLLWLLSA